MTTRVAVIGGGLAGLEAAAGLAAHDGVHVDVIERGPATRREHIQWDKTVHAGDEKVRRWRSDGWGAGGGLSERLGGRSLCWNGVLLGLEQRALEAWPDHWQARLTGPGGFYEQIYADLDDDFPAITRRRLSHVAEEIGLRHVPQCVVYEPQQRRLRSYSPLGEVLALAAAERVTITRGAVERLRERGTGGWVVEVRDDQQPTRTLGPVDVCILAASAIGNVQVLARSVEDAVTTRVTDHLALGAIVRIHRGDSLGAFEHREIWHGYTPIPGVAGNAFVVELGALPSGERVVELLAVLEQGEGPEDYSVVTVGPEPRDPAASTSIATRLTTRDAETLAQAHQELVGLAETIAGAPVADVSVDADVGSPKRLGAGDPISAEARWSGRDDAFRAVVTHASADCVASFSFPYGSFEHEACSHPLGAARWPAVDESLQVIDLPGVYAVGPGSFPRMGAANPALTLLSLSRWLAAEVASHS